MTTADYLTIAGIIASFAIPFAGWMAKMAVSTGKMNSKLDDVVEDIRDVRNEQSKLWTTMTRNHHENSDKLGRLTTKMAAVEVEVRHLKES